MVLKSRGTQQCRANTHLQGQVCVLLLLANLETG